MSPLNQSPKGQSWYSSSPASLLRLFNACHTGPWTKGSRDLDFRVQLDPASQRALLVFQGSKSREDWANNLRFFLKTVRPTPAYKDMPVVWRAHRGLLQPYKESSQKIDFAIPSWVRHLTIVGFSQGAAYATFAHEDFWFRRSVHSPDRSAKYAENPLLSICTYAFGGPRVLGLRVSKLLAGRFKGLVRCYVSGDLVTRVPPWFFGFGHVGRAVRLGRRRLVPRIKLHFPSEYRQQINRHSQ